MVKLKAFSADCADLIAALDGNIDVNNKGFVICDNGVPAGVLLYESFWDELPFLSLIKLLPGFRGKGIGTSALKLFEEFIKSCGFAAVLTSTRSDEKAQHFYRKAGYSECGCLILDKSKLKQPMEMFFIKYL